MSATSQDPFSTLGVEARPWLATDHVQERFIKLAGQHHPDANPASGSKEVFQSITLAHQTLRDPVKRLAAVLELEAPELLRQPSEQFIPSHLPDLFMGIATIQREVAAFSAQTAARRTDDGGPSALNQALLRGECLSLLSDLERLLNKVDLQWARCETQIQAADAVWERRTHESLLQLAAVYREMSYLKRWKEQLKESRLILIGLDMHQPQY